MKTVNSLMIFTGILMMLTSCETDVPETDVTPPNFSFSIKGDGLNQTFNQDTDFTSFQLNLRNGAKFDFVLIASDAGGLAKMSWDLAAPENYVFDDPIELPWTSTEISPLTRRIEWVGDRNNPLTGTTLSGSFTIDGSNIAGHFRFLVKDFGGSEGTPNQFYAELLLYVGDHDSEIIEF